MYHMADPENGTKFLDHLVHNATPEASFDWVLRDLTDFEAGDGRFTCHLLVSERTQNRYGTLHGGCTGDLAPQG